MLKFKTLLTILTLSLIGLLEVGCGHITIYDREVCVDVGAIEFPKGSGQIVGARCAHTLTKQTRNVPKAQWDQERIGQFVMNSQAYTDVETVSDQFCAAYPGICDYETRAAMQTTLTQVKPLYLLSKKVKRHLDLQIDLDLH